MNSAGGGRGFVFELVGAALVGEDVAARADIHRLIDRPAFAERVHVSDIYHVTRSRDWMVGGDGDVAGGDQVVAVIQSEADAAFGVVAGNDKRRTLDELEFQLCAARIRSPRTERSFEVFEHNPFCTMLTKHVKHLQFIGG